MLWEMESDGCRESEYCRVAEGECLFTRALPLLRVEACNRKAAWGFTECRVHVGDSTPSSSTPSCDVLTTLPYPHVLPHFPQGSPLEPALLTLVLPSEWECAFGLPFPCKHHSHLLLPSPLPRARPSSPRC